MKRMRTAPDRQRGITFLGWVVLLIPLAIVAYAGIRAAPAYLNYIRVSRAIEQTQKEYDGMSSITREALKSSLEKRFDTDYVENPKISDVSITKTAEGWVIEADYEELVPLLANASILLVFTKSAMITLLSGPATTMGIAGPGHWPLDWLRTRLGYEPRERALFETALTHRSASGPNNERLEFLGDAVLNLLVAQRLYRRHPDADEGDLSRLRARIVSAEPLADAAQACALGDALSLGSGELKSGGYRRQSILADALEALLGAVYLDRGLEAADAVVGHLLGDLIDRMPAAAGELKDAKTRLQELLQARGLGLPVYRVARIEGAPHEQHFRVTCEVDALAACGAGEGSSRRRAEQDAAAQVYALIRGDGAR